MERLTFGMLRHLSFLLPLLLAACSAGDPNDLILYKPPAAEVDGSYRTRSLLVTGVGAALGVERDATGGLWILEGQVPESELRPLLEDLRVSRHRRKEPAGTRGRTGPYQIWARIERKETSLRRYPEEPVAKEIKRAKDRLDATWESLTSPDDPVGVILAWLSSPIARVRGHAAAALLSAHLSPAFSPENHARVEAAISTLDLEETDPSIRRMLDDTLRKPSPR
jgi:hypothetical protein